MKDLLGPDESIINPFYMRQLLEYGIKLGVSYNGEINTDSLLREAEVYLFSFVLIDSCVYLFFIVPCSRTKRHHLKNQPEAALFSRLYLSCTSQIALSYLYNR